jgi:TolA-binding protein
MVAYTVVAVLCREQLVQLVHRLDVCAVEVDAAAKAIERETIADTEQILERLRNVKSLRTSAINQQALQLQEELESMERLVRRVEMANNHAITDAANGSTGVLLTSAATGGLLPIETVRAPKANAMIELIQQFSELASTIERMATKTTLVQVDFPSTDFPKETAERLEIISKTDRYVHALAVKDQMLWTTIKEKESLAQQLEAEKALNHRYTDDINEWARAGQAMKQNVESLKQERGVLLNRIQDLIDVLRANNIHYEY